MHEQDIVWENTPQLHRPGRDKYLSARVWEQLPKIYGDKGVFLGEFYTYIRWLDDIVDDKNVSPNTRMIIIKRQSELIKGGDIGKKLIPLEEYYQRIPFEVLDKPVVPIVRYQFYLLVAAIGSDVEHFGLKPRTRRDIAHYNRRIMNPYAQVVSCALNNRPLKKDIGFMSLMDSWNYLGGLLHLPRDIEEEGNVKVGFDQPEVDKITAAQGYEEKRREILTIYDSDRYKREWQFTLKKFMALTTSFWKTDMPFYQKIISFTYLATREPVRLPHEFRKASMELQQLREKYIKQEEHETF
ncbi:hypothetical protein IPM62_02635 [Candidatus Woesebacteria bacterium]|nr:MAG: hypothetical protein IPM62_02635 [Candidatus Woesebacteria bacterium]